MANSSNSTASEVQKQSGAKLKHVWNSVCSLSKAIMAPVLEEQLPLKRCNSSPELKDKNAEKRVDSNCTEPVDIYLDGSARQVFRSGESGGDKYQSSPNLLSPEYKLNKPRVVESHRRQLKLDDIGLKGVEEPLDAAQAFVLGCRPIDDTLMESNCEQLYFYASVGVQTEVMPAKHKQIQTTCVKTSSQSVQVRPHTEEKGIQVKKSRKWTSFWRKKF